MNELEEEEIVELVKAYLSGALSRLEVKQYEGAAVRIANALGVLSSIAPDSKGIRLSTALGFRLKSETDP